MIDIIPFNPLHLRHIDLQDDQRGAEDWLENEHYQQLLMAGDARTALYKGRIVVCAGVFPMTDWIGRVWALVSKDIGRELLPASRAITDFLKKSSYARLETPVRRDFSNGHRWCKLLGFVNETPEQGMKNYGHDGQTYDLYAFFPKEPDHGQIKPFQQTKRQ
ncbi:MAG: hypothetical protein ACPGQQ_05625 [Candidatus Puniceispirillaceae bacterium]